MFDPFKAINEPEQYRIINLVKNLRLPFTTIQQVLDISSDQMTHHLNILYKSGVVTCDMTSPLDMCRLNPSYVKEHPLFFELSLKQMCNTPLYQADLIKLDQIIAIK